MKPELDPIAVERRLAWLRAHYVPETVEQGRARLRAELESPDVFPSVVARRLDVLRALDDLRRYLAPAKSQLR
jgi:hypothetical protein